MKEGSQSLLFVWSWFQQTASGLRLREQELLSGKLPAAQLEPALIGLTPMELSDLFRRYELELDHSVSLTLMAATEAALRMDFNSRVARKLKDALSRTFRETKRRRGDKVRLDEDILTPWSAHKSSIRRAVGDFRGALKLRDWLAHGRYWNAKLGRQYDSQDIFGLSEAVLCATNLPID